jgi:Ser/Thr protein kinase RdoA (MazF antagonist)
LIEDQRPKRMNGRKVAGLGCIDSEQGWASDSQGLFPVAHSVLDPDALGLVIAANYHIENLRRCVFLRRGFHDTYVLTADRQYVVRVYRTTSSESSVVYELRLLRHLADHGVGVSAPVVGFAGQLATSLDAPEGIRQAALFTFAQGRSLDWNVTEAECAGRLLARIHSASDDFVAPVDRLPQNLAYLVDAPLAAIQPFLENRPQDLLFMRDVARRLHAAMRCVEDRLAWGVCHGDFNAGNIHVSIDGTLTAFDFDFCGPGWRASDFVGAWRWSRILDPGTWVSFLRGYREIRPISDIDIGAVAFLDGISRFRSLGLRATNASHRGTLPVVTGKALRQVTSLREWAAEQEQS